MERHPQLLLTWPQVPPTHALQHTREGAAAGQQQHLQVQRAAISRAALPPITRTAEAAQVPVLLLQLQHPTLSPSAAATHLLHRALGLGWCMAPALAMKCGAPLCASLQPPTVTGDWLSSSLRDTPARAVMVAGVMTAAPQHVVPALPAAALPLHLQQGPSATKVSVGQAWALPSQLIQQHSLWPRCCKALRVVHELMAVVLTAGVDCR
jgi:hypothetical protein